MFILSKDGKNFVNCNNVASIYIQEVYRQYTNPDRWWEIRAMYPAVSEDVLYDTLDKYYDEKNVKMLLTNCVVRLPKVESTKQLI